MLYKLGLRNIFLVHTFLNAIGIVGGQLIVLAATPVLARKYSPADFGIYASLVAVCGILGVGAALRFDMALPSSRDDEMPSMYRLSLLACMMTCMFGGAAVVLGLHRHIPWPQPLAATAMALLCIATGTLQAAIAASIGLMVRHGNFSKIAVLRVVQPGCFVLTALLGVSGGLLAAFCFSLIAAAACGLAFSWDQLVKPTRTGGKQIARKYWQFPVISVPTGMLDTLTLALPLLFLVQYYGEAAGGNYSQIQRLAAAPLILCGSAVAQVFYKHAGDATRAGMSARPLMWKTVCGLAAIGAAVAVLIALVGEPLFALLLGKGWRIDSYYLLLVMAPVILRVSVGSVSTIFPLSRHHGVGSLWQLAYATVTWHVLSFTSTRLSIDGLLVAILINEIVFYGVYLWLADVMVRRLEREATPCAA